MAVREQTKPLIDLYPLHIRTPIISRNVNICTLKIHETNYEIHLFKPPDSFRFDYMSEVLMENPAMLGLVFVVDFTMPSTFRAGRETIEVIRTYAPFSPYIIAVNKQDQADTWDIEALRIALKVPSSVPIISYVATDKKSVANVLIRLCEEILKDDKQDALE